MASQPGKARLKYHKSTINPSDSSKERKVIYIYTYSYSYFLTTMQGKIIKKYR